VSGRLPDFSDKPVLTAPEVAQILGLSLRSVRSAMANGDLPVVRVGGRVWVPTAALRRLLGVDGPEELSPASPDLRLIGGRGS